MPISDTRKWKINKSANEILSAVQNMLSAKKATFLETNDKRIEATLGSEGKTRVLGGMFVSKETLPVKITLVMNEFAGVTDIDATIVDNLGFGARTGMVGKYKDYIQSLFNEMASVLQVDAPPPPPPPQP